LINLFGIRWSVHPLFVIVMLASVATGSFTELLVLFVLVLVHEIGHVLAAKGYGWRIREVRLLPFGGVAETEEAGNLPAAEEAVVAIAGPLQHLWMGAAAWLLGRLGIWDADWANYIVQANVLIGLFNLLPVLPLDGGRLLQALCGYRFTYHRTLVWGARISLLFSLLMMVYALIPITGIRSGLIQPDLFAIGLFLFLTNWTYRRNLPYVFLRFLMHRNQASVRRIIGGSLAQPIVVTESKPITAILRLFLREKYHLIYVMEEQGKIVAVLPEQRIIDGYMKQGKPGSAVLELFR
jgi:stage IV sporulation protein FB